MIYKIEFDKRIVPELTEIAFRYKGQSSTAAEKFQTAFELALEILSRGVIDYAAFNDEVR